MKKRFLRLFLISFILVFLISGTVIIVKIVNTTPPDEALKIARESLAQAKKIQADKYESVQIKTATEYYNSAMKSWKIENEKFFLSRNYDITIDLATRATEQIKLATKKTQTRTGNLKNDLPVKVKELQRIVSNLQENFTELPVALNERGQYQKGKILLVEAASYLKKNDLLVAEQKYIQAEKLISSFNKNVERTLKDYFSHINKWKNWASETIEFSRINNTYCIVVDKFKHECYLYYDGKLVNTFDAEFGKNWIGNKKYQGDQATPEGKYTIIKKKDGGNTQYYKALLINYPNEEDKVQFRLNKKNGIISAGRGIGGLVEVHGGGGKGANWTEGCVALSNRDMDKLYSKCSVGTRITIVGSLRTLDEIIN